ncbi:MAG TPA: tetratricopeptide repeat-containing glycosyltransferase family protein [Luteibacter sp.]|nr:tetratricopeptide repeat-containing glycosyltransferase family protein [Luteibacter sp.]
MNTGLSDNSAAHHRDLCEILRRQSRLDEALDHGLRALALAPDDAEAHYNLGLVHADRLEIAQAIAAERRAVALEPDHASAHFELAELLLVNGQFDEGWREYEWRFRLPDVPPPLPPAFADTPVWDGRAMPEGRLLLVADQGFGDTIQFARYIPMVAERCPNLFVAGSAEVEPIVRQQPGIAGYFNHWERVPACDAYCTLSGLPRHFATQLGNIPAAIPYVRAEPGRVRHWRQRLDSLIPTGYRRIGLVWAGRATHGNDANRSTSLRTLAPLMALDGVAFVALRMEAALAQIGGYFGRAPLINLGAEIADFNDTMAIIDGLDMVVTVDTSVAHLAGAMGKPVSVLLPYAPDWRWMLDRGDSPWYPTMTLFRQQAPGHWPSALEELVRTLTSTSSMMTPHR